MDHLNDETDAFWLLNLFRRYHRNKPFFHIKPDAMSLVRNPPWAGAASNGRATF